MLILSRAVGRSIIIGDNIKITVLGFQQNQARLGIEAPKTISVHREEVSERIKKEEARAAQNEDEINGSK